MYLLLTTLELGCAAGTGVPGEESAAPVDTAADLGTPNLGNWGDGPASCEWFYASGPVDEHAVYVLRVTLPDADFEAGVDVSYDQELEPGELTLWFDDAATDTDPELWQCSDLEGSLVGRRADATAGRLHADALSTGPDEVCGSQQTYEVTWKITDILTEAGAADDLGPYTGRAGYFGDCYG
jgi:hypothetical protein